MESSESSSLAGIQILGLRFDLDDRITYTNSAFLTFFNIKKEDLLGAPLSRLKSIGYPELIQPLFERPLPSDPKRLLLEDNRHFELKVILKDELYHVTWQDVSETHRLKGLVQRYVSADLLNSDDPSMKVPERRFMSVTFTDLRGFTSLSEKLEPDQVRTVLNLYLEEAIRAVEENKGSVDKIVGDEVMALFGAPIHYENHAQRAIETGLQQIHYVGAMRELAAKNGRELPFCGVGVNTGDMILGNMGNRTRMDYTVIGSAVNLGARLCSEAAPGQVLCSEFTLKSLIHHLPKDMEVLERSEAVKEPLKNGGVLDEFRKVWRIGVQVQNHPAQARYVFVSLPAVKLKGIAEPVPIYSVHSSLKKSIPLSETLTQRSEVIRTFGRYELVRELGRGGMGQVYLGKDGFGNPLAIKMLLSGSDATESQLTRFQREAEVMSKLSHRYICRILEVGDYENTRYIAMEYIAGRPLDQLLNSEGLSHSFSSVAKSPLSKTIIAPQERRHHFLKFIHNLESESKPILELFLKILEALGYAHQHNILHRDLKASNVMIRDNGEPVLMDFGLAKFSEDDSNISMTGQMVGTIDYVAPEQAAGRKDIGPGADVYAATALLYRMLTGQKHFSASGNLLFDIDRLQNHHPIPPKTLRPNIGNDLDVICLKGLDPEIEHRYLSTQDLADDIRSVLDGRAIMAKREHAGQKMQRWVKRHRTLSFTIAMACTALFGILIYHYISITSALHRFQLEQERANKTLSELKVEMDQRIADREWDQVEDLAIRIQTLDQDDEKSQQILQRVEVEKLDRIMPLRFHPSSGLPSRIQYYHQQLKRWEKCFDNGNPLAQSKVEKIQQQISKEELASEALNNMSLPGPLLEDDYGLAFIHPLGFKFRYIPPGVFSRGDEEHSPIRTITITRGFFLTETEVTQQQWTSENFAFENDSAFKDPQHPVHNLEWGAGQFFCEVFNELDGYDRKVEPLIDSQQLHLPGYRLPTEAEWEYACRADVHPNQNFWWERLDLTIEQPLWYDENSGPQLQSHSSPVAQWKPNPWGLYDMHGNVFEWVLDSFDGNFYSTSPSDNPLNSKDTPFAVIKGGSYLSRLFQCRAGHRVKIDREASDEQLGFRICFIPPLRKSLP